MDYERKRAFAALPDQGAVPRYEAVYAYNQRKRGPYLYDRNDRLPENYEGARGNLIPRPYTAQDGTELIIIQVGIPVQLLERCGVDHPTLSLTQIQPLTISAVLSPVIQNRGDQGGPACLVTGTVPLSCITIEKFKELVMGRKVFIFIEQRIKRVVRAFS